MAINTWGNVLRDSLQNTWYGVANHLPQLVIAIIIVIIGWIIAVIIGKVVAQIIGSLKVDSVLRSMRVEEAVNRAGMRLNSGHFIGALVKWFIIIVFLLAAFNVLGLTQVTDFLKEVVLHYLPNVIIAVLILLVAVLIADAMQKVVVGSARAASIRSANFLGSVTKWAILIFAVFIALSHLGIGGPLIPVLFQGIVIALSIGFGLAFGLGGQEAASRFIERIRTEISDKHMQ